jgi:hypothetical protein
LNIDRKHNVENANIAVTKISIKRVLLLINLAAIHKKKARQKTQIAMSISGSKVVTATTGFILKTPIKRILNRVQSIAPISIDTVPKSNNRDSAYFSKGLKSIVFIF